MFTGNVPEHKQPVLPIVPGRNDSRDTGSVGVELFAYGLCFMSVDGGKEILEAARLVFVQASVSLHDFSDEKAVYISLFVFLEQL